MRQSPQCKLMQLINFHSLHFTQIGIKARNERQIHNKSLKDKNTNSAPKKQPEWPQNTANTCTFVYSDSRPFYKFLHKGNSVCIMLAPKYTRKVSPTLQCNHCAALTHSFCSYQASSNCFHYHCIHMTWDCFCAISTNYLTAKLSNLGTCYASSAKHTNLLALL